MARFGPLGRLLRRAQMFFVQAAELQLRPVGPAPIFFPRYFVIILAAFILSL